MEQMFVKKLSVVVGSCLVAGALTGQCPAAAEANIEPDSYEAILAEGNSDTVFSQSELPDVELETAGSSEEAVAVYDEADTSDERSDCTDPDGSEASVPFDEFNQDETDNAVVTDEQPSENLSDAVFPWEDMSDTDFAEFIRLGKYAEYETDGEAIASLLSRAEMIADEELRSEILPILQEWVASLTEELALDSSETIELIASDEQSAMLSGAAAVEDLYASDMCWKQQPRSCTLTANAMMIRRAARLLGWDYTTYTEDLVRSVGWIEGTGMQWYYSCYGISVAKADFSSPNLDTMISLLQSHPEGIVAYDRDKPHAVLISDYTDGILYCVDPADGNRKPVTESYIRNGNQASTIATFDYYWYVSSPQCTLPANPVVSVIVGDTGEVTLTWNNVYCSGYRIMRSESADNNWEEVYIASGDEFSWTDTDTKYKSTYYYKVSSLNSIGNVIYDSTVISCEVSLPEGYRVVITEQPSDLTVRIGYNAIFYVSCRGVEPSYQWYYSDNRDGNNWIQADCTGNAFQIPVTDSTLDGYYFYCKVSDIAGDPVDSEIVQLHVAPSGVGFWLDTAQMGLDDMQQFFIDNVAYNASDAGIDISEGSIAVTYGYCIEDLKDPHTWYPTSMKVWRLTCNPDTGCCDAEYIPEFENLMSYYGTSIRIAGKKGIRVITEVPAATRSALMSTGVAGYMLVEYGTLACWSSSLSSYSELTLSVSAAHYNYAYSKSAGSDAVFRYAGSTIQYTNVLVGYTDDQCSEDITIRPYMILEDTDGNQITLYGGYVCRSIGYVAWQNRNAFPETSDAGIYVREIIEHVYGEDALQEHSEE